MDEYIYESDVISNNDIEFTIDADESNAPDQLAIKSNLHSFVASSEQDLHHTLSAAPKHAKLTTCSMIMRVDCGSNAMLVISPSSLHNVMKTTNEVGNTGEAQLKQLMKEICTRY